MSDRPREQQRGCVIVPAYREERQIAAVVRGIRAHVADVIVIDDGSPDRTAAEAEAAGARVLRHERNRGKGVALNTGFAYARERQFDYLITLDADGQHAPEDIPRFIDAYVRTGIPVLIGNRMSERGGGMPFVRRLTNRFMSWYLSREMRQYVPDTQCGFRLYRCDVIPFVETEAERYAAESEILLHIAARGIRMDAVPITLIYGDEKSKIHPLRDTLRFFQMIRRLRRRRSHARRMDG